MRRLKTLFGWIFLISSGLILHVKAAHAGDPNYVKAIEFIRDYWGTGLVSKYHPDPFHQFGLHGPWNRPGNMAKGINHYHIRFRLDKFENEIIFWKNLEESVLRWQCKNPGEIGTPTIIPTDIQMGMRMGILAYNDNFGDALPLDERISLQFNDELRHRQLDLDKQRRRVRKMKGGSALGCLGILSWFFGVESSSAADRLGGDWSEEDSFEFEAAMSTLSGGPNKYEMILEQEMHKYLGPGEQALIRFSHRNRW